MFATDINYWAIFVAAIANMAVGALWYSPGLFGKKWMALVGKTEEELKQINPGKAYGLTFVASIVTAYVLARVIYGVDAQSLGGGIWVSFTVWLGLTAATALPHYLFEDRSLTLFRINFGYSLVGLLIMGIIIGVW